VALNFKKYKSGVYREKDYSMFFSLMKNLEKKYQADEIWVAAPGDNFYYYTGTYLDHRGISNVADLKNNFPSVKKKTILVFVLYNNEVAAYNDFLLNNGAVLYGKAGFTNFYTIELNP
jgi:hypothetical protein